jgi:alpha-L-fucosidase
MNAPQPTPAQADWMKLGYGLFLHFGPNTFTGEAWGKGNFPPEHFDPRQLNTDQWAATAAEAGMKYAVLTSKHHDGFCLWPSAFTDYCVKHSPGQPDIVAAFVESFRKAGLKTGLYYSLWDRHYPDYDNDELYAEYMQNQLRELLTHYGDIVQLWFDGAWDKDHPTRQWPYDKAWETQPDSGLKHGERWQWRTLYELIHSLQPNCLVISNSSSDRPGWVKYMPIDVRTSEHFNFIWKEQICEPILDPVYTTADGEQVYLPLEFCTSLNPNWFWSGDHVLHPSVATIVDWHRFARRHQANLLLNVGPNRHGLIPDYHRHYLRLAAREIG